MTAYEWLIGAWTIFLVYCIGFYYAVVEFFRDRFSNPNQSYMEHLQTETERSQFRRSSIARRYPTAVVTGASGTIGVEIVRSLLKLGYRVEALAREEGLLLMLKDERLSVHILDMADLKKVKNIAEEIVTNAPEGIDLVICCAGVMLHPYEVGVSGHEQHMAVNVLSHALLVDVILSQMHHMQHLVRIVFVSSSTAHTVRIDADALSNADFFARYINGYHAYAISKLTLALYAEELNRHLEEKICADFEGDVERCSVKVCSVHPGCVPGDLYRNVFHPCRILINQILAPFMRKGEVAAAEVIATVMSDHLKGGTYYEHMEPVPLRPDISNTVRQQLFIRIQQTIRKLLD
ncbi:Retinol dehydrogenase 12 [Toxocara canis]|uniref:Retinol dehydrogenase 12 n=1 Tax=Toxocara canis TaxID=6265 RepID=A0A0B2V6E7_TOXCA|nr:Retinol dehydrogenase 12 [Toxocara canis]